MKIRKYRAFYLHEERTGNTLLGVQFPTNLGGSDFITADSDLAESPEKLRIVLKKKGARLTGPKAKQLTFIQQLLANVESDTFKLAMKPGWRGDGFILGKRMLGTAKGAYIWRPTAAAKPDIGQKAGTLEGWTKEVAPIVSQSSFAVFAMLITLAAPLVTYVQQRIKSTTGLSPLLSETTVFNFSGDSRIGKSSLSRAAAGIFGSPDAIFKWDFTRPGLEVLAEARNDLVLVLDDTEKLVETDITLKNALRLVGQVIPSGQSKALSDLARDNGALERRWTTFGISSSPLPLDELAHRDGWTRTLGEQVRFINIALPKGSDAGIFDRLPEHCEDRVEAGKLLIKSLERAVALHFGHIMPAWIEFLLTENRALKIQQCCDHFTAKVAADGTGYEKDFAQKFALPYAAGKLAIEAGILPWPKDWPWKAVRRCHKLAQMAATPADVQAVAKIEALIRLINQSERFPKVASTGSKAVVYGSSTVGIRTVVNGKPICAIRKRDLLGFAGSQAVAKAICQQMALGGAIGAGQGSAATSQPGLKIKIGSEMIKPRFLIIDENKLRQLARQ